MCVCLSDCVFLYILQAQFQQVRTSVQVLFDICNNTGLKLQLNVDKKVQSTPYEEN